MPRGNAMTLRGCLGVFCTTETGIMRSSFNTSTTGEVFRHVEWVEIIGLYATLEAVIPGFPLKQLLKRAMIHSRMTAFHSLFSNKDVLIGAVHFPPLLGYDDFPGFERALHNAQADIEALEKGGADAVILENNYDIPHKSRIDTETVIAFAYLADKLKDTTTLPIGISVLWNDYRTALSLARVHGFTFVRIPVFVDTVETQYGTMEGVAEDATSFRERIGAHNVAICADIHVKHATITSDMSITESASQALSKGADALIITGDWTAHAPDTTAVKEVKQTVPSLPLLCGSGVTADNARELLNTADGAIVSTSLKEGGENTDEVNVKGYEQRISSEKVKALRSAVDKGWASV